MRTFMPRFPPVDFFFGLLSLETDAATDRQPNLKHPLT
jgi:hypothetical protein